MSAGRPFTGNFRKPGRFTNDRGFVLISAMWLLLLGAAIAALLMLRSMGAARDLAVDDDRFIAERTSDDAIETVAADLILNGRASRWSQMPMSGSVTFGDRSVTVSARAEEAVPDVGKTDLNVVDGVLHDNGLSSAERVAILDRIAAAREAGHRISSYAELASLGNGILPVGREDCLAAMLSPFGGNGSPSGRAAPPGQAAQFAGASTGGAQIGSVIRLTIGSGAMRRIVAMRLIGANDRPYALLDDFESSCPGTQAETPA